MASTLATPKTYSVPHFVGKNYEIALNQSIEALLTSLASPDSRNSSSFTSNFLELVQSKADPPLETIWVFAALTYTDPSTPINEPLDRIIAIKDLLQLIISCSASCNSIKSIALVAPVIYILHNFILDLKSLQLGPNKEREVKREIKGVVDSVIGYINVCCNGVEGKIDDLIRPMNDLIRVWIVDNVDSLRVFFPLLSDDTIAKVSVEGFGMVELAGFVVAEAFLLKLCWKIEEEGIGGKMKDELKSWVVGSITGFRNSYFYVTLASMLLEPVLPITSIMNLEYEDGLRKILYDALILVEYSFLSPENLSRLPAAHAKRVNFTKLMVTNEAIDLFREHGEKTKAISFLNAFTNSSLPSQIMNWVRSEIGNEFSNIEPNGSSPRAFLKWMLNIENRGIKIFDNDMSKYRAKLISHNLQEELEQIAKREGGKKPDSDLLFYIDNKGQEEYGNREDEDMNKSLSAAFMAAAHSMESSENGGRKRKTKNGEMTEKVKFVKYNLVGNSAVPRNDDLSSGSEIENPDSDEDMEVK
ncbi:hypothetical protein ACJIZ3_018771 [Penstemon smallii]|uniref:CUE domain-containing protein n=1 Tax=Penstemon smallii TaxID=265156 RepID=A0ABD3SZB2_9LAMI